jgi:hypothetical protein
MSDEHPELPASLPPAIIPDGKEQCQYCGKLLTVKSMGGHVRKQHGIYIRRPRGRPPGSKNRPKTPLSVVPDRRTPLTAEEITQAVAAMLWPDGVPPDRLERLLRWHTQTAVFLDMVQDSE